MVIRKARRKPVASLRRIARRENRGEVPATFPEISVIHISFKETKASNFEDCLLRAKANLRTLYGEHRQALEGKLAAPDAAQFQAIWDGSANNATYVLSLKLLTQWIHQVQGVPPIVLIDEYDAGIHAAYANGFYK